MQDSFEAAWNAFFQTRTKPLNLRFPGSYRAVVVETNDALQSRRIKFKIPDLHDWDLKPEDCPWAVTASDLGGKRAGRFSYPCIGDWVWISFEKNHPYGPICTGFATPTRRKFYALPSLYGETQIPVGQNSDIADKPQDYNKDYLPKDGRPMSHGWQDRYGNLDMHDATGFFPTEHDITPPPAEADPLSKGKFSQAANKPIANNPDSKMMLRATKYGMILLQSDVGYNWKLNGDKGEFSGDFDKDEKFEIKRWLDLQKIIHEDHPTSYDMRKIMFLSRYGNKLEMRDVGWNSSRPGEWSDQKKTIGSGDDQRWVKLRTKGGMLIELCDIGFDPENDEFVSRLLLDEAKNTYLDREDQYSKTKSDWNQYGSRDMRMLRFVTRSGIKIVADDRGSHDGGKYLAPFSSSAAARLNQEIGIGVLIKGRATPGAKADYAKKSGDPRGYFWQFDERPSKNHTAWGTPLGQVMGMDDNEESLTICSRLPDVPTKWKYLDDNEFLDKSIDSQEAAAKTHHLIIDHGRELIRLKTRAGHGDASKGKKLGEAASGEFAGLEIHDAPQDDPWTEVIDHDKRGMWFSRKNSLGVWRAKDGKDMLIWMDDSKNKVVIHNGTDGKVQIYCSGDVEVVAGKTLKLKGNVIEMKANEIRLESGGTSFTLDANALKTNADIHAKNIFAFFPTIDKPKEVSGKGVGAQSGGGYPVSNVELETVPSATQPTNRLGE